MAGTKTTLPISGRTCWRDPNLEGPITFVEALRSWGKAGPQGFRGVNVENHWHLLNLWEQEDMELLRRDENPCPDCGHWMSDTTGVCHQCETGEWSYS